MKVIGDIRSRTESMAKSMNNLRGFREFTVVLALALVVVGGVMLVWITPDSGYHPVDDHEFLMWTYLLDVKKVPLTELIWEYNLSNLALGRFRPLYLCMRGIFIWLFKADIRKYYIWAVIKTIITFISLYYMFKGISGSFLNSLSAVLVTLVGYQSAAWWKLGTHEIVSLLWFSLGMTFLIAYLDKDSKASGIISFVSFLIMSLYKESFIVLIPFVLLFILLRIYEKAVDRDILTDIKDKRFDLSFLKKIPKAYFLGLMLVFIIETGLIVFVLGKDYLDAGGTGIRPLIDSFTGDMKWFVIFGQILAVIIISRDREALKILKDLLLFLAFILPQFYLFKNAGMEERYLIPFSAGFALFFIALVPMHMDMGRLRVRLYCMSVTFMLLAQARAMLIEGDYYKHRGYGMTAMMDAVKEVSVSRPDTKILSTLYYEVGYTIYANNLLAGADNVYYMTPDWETGGYEILPVEYFHMIGNISNQPEISGLEDMDIILAYNQKDRHWEYHASEFLGLSDEDYYSREFETFTVYVRRDSGIEL